MKMLSLKVRQLAGLALVWFTGGVAFAQVLSGGSPASLNTAFVKLFGPATAFTAKVDTFVLDPAQHETLRMTMDFAVLEGKARLDINLAQVTSKDLSPSILAGEKQRGMDRVTSIFRPDKKLTYTIYPGIQSYVSKALPKEEAEASEKGLKLEKQALGRETLDGHACVKNWVTVKDDKGPVLEATTWNATDLKDFPLQIEMKQKENTVRMRFSQVHLAKPDAKQFEVPAHYGLIK